MVEYNEDDLARELAELKLKDEAGGFKGTRGHGGDGEDGGDFP